MDQREALRAMAGEDPELAARLILMTLPASASRIRGDLTYDLEVEGLGKRRVSVSGGRARVDESPEDGETDLPHPDRPPDTGRPRNGRLRSDPADAPPPPPHPGQAPTGAAI